MCGLLIITKDPMTANQIADALSISRGNVSMGIKELQSWQLIKVMHIPGDRKEYYAPAGDIWDMANRVFEERKKREVETTLSLLR
ncbi:GbsR/MarR family transcriptional regulator, partial [Pseudomonas sp. SIMBA_067]|uniref:GbsR/MarR family transcriptional regulator n=1 Tax=Pseudomonas sp. SIMBA_067 TaxID=3085807 RepID=UPI00397E464D